MPLAQRQTYCLENAHETDDKFCRVLLLQVVPIAFASDDDVFNALQGTWVMENEDYYGSYKIQFTGRGGHRWKKEAGGSEWVDGGELKLFEIKKYENNTKMNQGSEYLYVMIPTSER